VTFLSGHLRNIPSPLTGFLTRCLSHRSPVSCEVIRSCCGIPLQQRVFLWHAK